MDFVYGFGVTCIQYAQEYFHPTPDKLEIATKLSDAFLWVDYLFPIISVVDSVFASQLILCLGAGTWITLFLKWCLQEPRPYWWVQATNYYVYDRPALHQVPQTCETTLGSPSMHAMTVTTMVFLFYMWSTHIFNDYRKAMPWWFSYMTYPIMTYGVIFVCLCRMYVAAAFPHQLIFGVGVGIFISTLCCVTSDFIIWKREIKIPTLNKLAWFCVVLASIEMFKDYLYRDLDWGVPAAEKYCRNPAWIVPAASPRIYNVQSIATIIGWLAIVSPKLSKFRHYSRRRSIILSFLASLIFYHIIKAFEVYFDLYNSTANINRVVILLIYTLKPAIYLLGVPYFATLPYTFHNGVTNNLPVRNSPPAL